MTYQDYVDQPRTLEAALECIRRLTVERDKTSRAYWDAREDVSRLTLQRDRLTAANRDLREELSSMATDQLGDLGQAMERDGDLERARTVAVALEQELAHRDQLVYVGRYCWRCEGLVSDSCQSDNVPIYVDAEWADDMRTEIARLEEENQT